MKARQVASGWIGYCLYPMTMSTDHVALFSAQRVRAHTSDEVAALERLQPSRRGFWTDAELLQDSGLKSVAILKKLAGTRWLMPDHGPLPEGGRRRLWVFGEVVRAAVVSEVTSRTSIPLIAVGMILNRAGFTWVNHAIALNSRIEALVAEPVGNKESAPSRLLVLDGQEVWAESAPGRFRLISAKAVLGGQAIRVPPPPRSVEAALERLNDGAVSIHAVNLANLNIPLFGQLREQLSIT